MASDYPFFEDNDKGEQGCGSSGGVSGDSCVGGSGRACGRAEIERDCGGRLRFFSDNDKDEQGCGSGRGVDGDLCVRASEEAEIE
ncbi:hypothetical protein FH972_000839 [Carpinus fangiana]|uniref:Uncharacterized protein n=1 Tax=Carpinus fangiana TaxID=176857 RepID=A0A5N6QC99_9ROSI|nr:hypothetical protein FH972_000839 [Carpinus fangiana]